MVKDGWRSNMTSTVASDSLSEEDSDEPPICFRPGWKFYSAMTIFMIMTLAESVNSTSTSSALPTLSTELGGTTTMHEFIGDAYMLASGVLQLPISALGDIFGRRELTIASFLLFLGGNICCAAAPNMAAMLGGRTVKGIGAAGTLVIPEVFIADYVPLRYRGQYFAFISAMWSLGAGLGPILGGGFADIGQWRWIFWIHVPICGLALLATPFAVRLPPPEGSKREKLAQLDYIGAFLVVGSTTSLVLGLTLGGTAYPWGSPNVLVPLIVGFLALIVTGVYEYYVAKQPLLAVKVFGNRSSIIAYLHTFVQGILMEGLPYYLPLYFQGALSYSPVISGVALLPLTIGILPTAIVFGWLVTFSGRYKWQSVAGWACASCGLGLLLLLDKDSSVGDWIGVLIPNAIGMGCQYSLLGTLIQAPNPKGLWTDAAAIMSFVRALGEVFGVAVGGSVFSSCMQQQTKSLGQGGDYNAMEAVSFINSLEAGELRDELQDALIYAIHTVFVVYLALSLFSFLANFLLVEYPLDSGEVKEMDETK